jgi:hypothetical protein
MRRRLFRLAVIVAGTGGLVGLVQAAAEAKVVGNHCEPLR